MSSSAWDGLGLALSAAGLALAYLRWLRVAQREHYLAGSASRFALRWWSSTVANKALAVVGGAGAIVALFYAPAGLAAAVVAGAGPLGLGLKGRSSPLAWTGRLRRLAGTATIAAVLAVALSGLLGAGLRAAYCATALCALGAPALVDLALAVTGPVERRMLRPFVDRAARRLQSVSPRVVAITGSYGKTTTKGYVAHLASGSLSVVASPKSFNNLAGLARAVNDHLTTGTQVFVAEMGTYGPGEIAQMCRWATPEVAVITAIGPVHLERMKTLERIAEAKAEILQPASTVVLNIDYPLLAQLAQKAEEEGKTVWRCSGQSERADVSVVWEGPRLRARASHFDARLDLVVDVAPETEPGNVACAIAAVLSLGVAPQALAGRLSSLPGAPHRRSTTRTAKGAVVIDDTYNSNPAGAKAALGLLQASGGPEGKKVVVTPGMVELGASQARENSNFAASAGAIAQEVVVVGRTNGGPLRAGARAAGVEARLVRDRAAAVAWVSANLGPGDAVLYENDLPDHYP